MFALAKQGEPTNLPVLFPTRCCMWTAVHGGGLAPRLPSVPRWPAQWGGCRCESYFGECWSRSRLGACHGRMPAVDQCWSNTLKKTPELPLEHLGRLTIRFQRNPPKMLVTCANPNAITRLAAKPSSIFRNDLFSSNNYMLVGGFGGLELCGCCAFWRVLAWEGLHEEVCQGME